MNRTLTFIQQRLQNKKEVDYINLLKYGVDLRSDSGKLLVIEELVDVNVLTEGGRLKSDPKIKIMIVSQWVDNGQSISSFFFYISFLLFHP